MIIHLSPRLKPSRHGARLVNRGRFPSFYKIPVPPTTIPARGQRKLLGAHLTEDAMAAEILTFVFSAIIASLRLNWSTYVLTTPVHPLSATFHPRLWLVTS